MPLGPQNLLQSRYAYVVPPRYRARQPCLEAHSRDATEVTSEVASMFDILPKADISIIVVGVAWR